MISATEPSAWSFATRAMAVLAVAPHALGGLHLRASPGPIRDHWLTEFKQLSNTEGIKKIPIGVSESRLLGGLDLTATLQLGRPVAERGLLANCHQSIALLAMAERASDSTVTHLCTALDQGFVRLERDGLTATHSAELAIIALDEGIEDENIAPRLRERLALRIDLAGISLADLSDHSSTQEQIAAARERYLSIELATDKRELIVQFSLALGIDSPRAWLQALHVLKILCALDGFNEPSEQHLLEAVALTFSHRATRLPQSPEPPAEQPEPTPPQEAQEGDTESTPPPEKSALPEDILEAALATLPPDVLRALTGGLAKRSQSKSSSRAGAAQRHQTRGRPAGTTRGQPGHGKRLNILATLRAAAPFQKLRAVESDQPRRIRVLPDDFRLTRYKHRQSHTTVFVVDASGSSALHRLAEAKGAIELLLAECYVRRDQVALIAFRGQQAELLLPPTRSLVRAKKSLAALPGGGGTPLASAIALATRIAEQVQAAGGNSGVVFLTDGVANIDREGRPGRRQASEDAKLAAHHFRGQGIPSLLIDTAPRPQQRARDLAQDLRAEYLPMPRADATALSRAAQHVNIS